MPLIRAVLALIVAAAPGPLAVQLVCPGLVKSRPPGPIRAHGMWWDRL